MKFSIVIPTYNEEKYVFKILEQFKNAKNIEVIISDNKSTDATLKLANDYSAKVVANDTAQKFTIGECRNNGARIAQGDVICFFDADTWMAKPDNFIKELEQQYLDQSLVAIIGPVRIDPQEEYWLDRVMFFLRNFMIRTSDWLGLGGGSGEFLSMRQRIWKDLGGFNSQYAAGEDNEFFQRIRQVGKIKFVNKLLVYTSPRHIRRIGWIKQWWEWTVNFWSVFVFKKSAVSEWKAHR